jgi:enoyl reductase-like protein
MSTASFQSPRDLANVFATIARLLNSYPAADERHTFDANLAFWKRKPRM